MGPRDAVPFIWEDGWAPETRYHLYGRMGGPHSRSERMRSISLPPEFDHRTAQSVASCYTVCTIAAHIYYGHPTTHKIHCAGTTKFLILERSVHRVTTVTKVVILPILLFLHMDCTLRLI